MDVKRLTIAPEGTGMGVWHDDVPIPAGTPMFYWSGDGAPGHALDRCLDWVKKKCAENPAIEVYFQNGGATTRLSLADAPLHPSSPIYPHAAPALEEFARQEQKAEGKAAGLFHVKREAKMSNRQIGAGTRVIVHGGDPEGRTRAGMVPWNGIYNGQIGKLGDVLGAGLHGAIRVNLDDADNRDDYWEFLPDELRMVIPLDHPGLLLAGVAAELEREANNWALTSSVAARAARRFAKRLRAGQVSERRRTSRREEDKDAG